MTTGTKDAKGIALTFADDYAEAVEEGMAEHAITPKAWYHSNPKYGFGPSRPDIREPTGLWANMTVVFQTEADALVFFMSVPAEHSSAFTWVNQSEVDKAMTAIADYATYRAMEFEPLTFKDFKPWREFIKMAWIESGEDFYELIDDRLVKSEIDEEYRAQARHFIEPLRRDFKISVCQSLAVRLDYTGDDCGAFIAYRIQTCEGKQWIERAYSHDLGDVGEDVVRRIARQYGVPYSRAR